MSAGPLSAEPRLVQVLGRIDSAAESQSITQQRADTLLARIAWSRIAEPGDGVAGLLTAVLGVEKSLSLLAQGVGAKELLQAFAEACDDEHIRLTGRSITEALARWVPRLSRSETVADIEQAAALGLSVLLPGDPLWPAGLDDLGSHAPNMLWVRGNPEMIGAYSLGVVGARAATGYGSHVTAELVDGVCRAGVAIVSGAAYGIDAVAHRTALAAETPTIAVVAGGADRPYPRAHESLLDRIASAGAVCSEMVPGSAPTRWRFLQRNRLIAALSHATLVTEAGVNSGSLNTAGHAAQLGRQIGAVPGPITSAASAGCHRLIRDYDAMLITSTRDVCELAGVDETSMLFGGAGSAEDDDSAGDDASADGSNRSGGSESGSHGNDSESTRRQVARESEDRESASVRRVCDALPLRGFRDLVSIAKLAGLSPDYTRGVLSELELLGRVKRRDAGEGGVAQWSLVKQ